MRFLTASGLHICSISQWLPVLVPLPLCSLSAAGGGDLPGNTISCQLLPLWASCQSSPDVRAQSCPGDWLAGPRASTGEGEQIQAWDRVGDNDQQSLGEERTGAGERWSRRTVGQAPYSLQA